MKVKCVKIYNEHTKEYQETSHSITIGKEYIVLAIEIRQDCVHFLIISDFNEEPLLQNAIQFEVVSKKIPSTWHIDTGDFELLVLEPKAWGEPGFWDDCYDGDPAALEIYKREAMKIIEEENGGNSEYS